MTRSSGYSVSAEVRLRETSVSSVVLAEGDAVEICFSIPGVEVGDRIGFGGWFIGSDSLDIDIQGGLRHPVVSNGNPPVWRKFGSQWVSDTAGDVDVIANFWASKRSSFALYETACGLIGHDGIDTARPELLKNMAKFAPEANFYIREGETEVVVSGGDVAGDEFALALKSCNRCGRFLPVNLPPDERATLSFSNHCVSRAPCDHSSFGRIQDADDPSIIHTLNFGFQLECRYCKKFYVNAALNPQRTAGQMKEDAARRRAFEVLLEDLYRGSPQLRYKNLHGRDLADSVYENFKGECFKCGTPLGSARKMHLDHTRPLALLWPLDEHATALCADCNSAKRDRPPSDFYNANELRRLADVTGLHLSDLSDPSPNEEAIRLLGERLDWFFDDFIPSGRLDRVREGKATAALLVKAIQKAIARTPGGPPYDIVAEAARRGIH